MVVAAGWWAAQELKTQENDTDEWPAVRLHDGRQARAGTGAAGRRGVVTANGITIRTS